jgi:hypothetical protein
MTAERPIKVETIENTCGTSENKTSWILAALFGFHMSGCQNLTWLMVIARYTGLPQTLIDPNVGTPTRQKMERLRGTTKKDSDFTNFHLRRLLYCKSFLLIESDIVLGASSSEFFGFQERSRKWRVAIALLQEMKEMTGSELGWSKSGCILLES